MEIAKIRVTQNQVELEQSSCVTAGMVGAAVIFESFGPEWDGLSKTAVFRTNRGESRDVVNVQAGEPVVIPWEVLGTVGADLMAGVCGTDTGGTQVIPTVWGSLGRIASGARPVGRPAEPPTPNWTQRIEGQVSRALDAAHAVGPLAQQAAESAKAAEASAENAAGAAGRAETAARHAREQAVAANESVDTVGKAMKVTVENARTAADAATRAAHDADRAEKAADQAVQAGGGIMDHSRLTNRNAPEQHSLEAITGLKDALADKLNAAALPAAVNDALAQAKASGQFDGRDGSPGKTPVKGVDYFTSADRQELVGDVLKALPAWKWEEV